MSEVEQREPEAPSTITVLLPVELRSAVVRLAEQGERSIGGEVRLALREHVDRERRKRGQAA